MSEPIATLADEQLINRIVEERIKSAGFVTREELNQRIAEVEQRAGDHANQLVSQAIAAAEGRLNAVLSQVQQSISSVQQTVSTLAGEWRLWRDAADERFTARSEQITTLQQTVNRHDDAIDDFRDQQNQNVSDIRALTTTIHGDPEVKDGAPSLYGMVSEISTDLKLKLPSWQTMIEGRETILIGRLEILEDKEKAREDRVARRRQIVKACWEWVNKTGRFQTILLLILGAIVFAISPGLALSVRDWFEQIKAIFSP